tara:strand:- start:23116 stop:24006 length:891 start_codon:yes stop_codon:yes gene_type:complete
MKILNNFYNTSSALLIFTTLFWAFNTIFGQLAVGEISPLQIVPLRWILVSSVMWFIFGNDVKTNWQIIKPEINKIIFMALMGFTGFNVLFYTASQYTNAINLGIIQSSVPVYVLLGAYFFYKTSITALQGLGVMISIIGVTIITTNGDIEILLNLQLNKGDLIMLVACLMYSYYTLSLKTRLQIPGIAFFTLMSVIANFLALPLFIIDYLINGINYPSINGLIITILVAIFPSSLAQIFYLRAVDIAGPGKAGIYTNIVPIFSSILAVILLNQRFEIFHGISLVLVLSGIWLSERK